MPVRPEWTIQFYDARLPAVLSTPAMIGVMELAAAEAVQAELPPGAITVGTRIEVDHLKAVSLGAIVHAHARLVGREGRFLIFDVEARSGELVIGRGRVFRTIVEPTKFAAAAEGRSTSQPQS
jgi:fluoroacetyl-CoA thioesterase